MDDCLRVSIGHSVAILPLIKVDAGLYLDQCELVFCLSADDLDFAGIWSAINAHQDAVVTFGNEVDPNLNFETDLPGYYSLSLTPVNEQCV